MGGKSKDIVCEQASKYNDRQYFWHQYLYHSLLVLIDQSHLCMQVNGTHGEQSSVCTATQAHNHYLCLAVM